MNDNNKPNKLYQKPVGLVQDILFLNENEFITSGDAVTRESALYSIVVWDFNSTAQLSDQIYHEKYICTCLKKHPSHSLFYALSHGNYIAEFSARSPFKINKYKRYEAIGYRTEGYSIGFDISSSGTLIASGSLDGAVYIFDVKSSKLSKKMKAFIMPDKCLDVKFSNFANFIACSSSNGLIKIFELT